MNCFREFSSFLLLGVIVCVSAVAAPDDALPPHRDGVVLVRFQPGVSSSQQDMILRSLGIGVGIIKRLGGGDVQMLQVGNGRVAKIIERLKQFNEVLYAEPDFLATLDDGRPFEGPPNGEGRPPVYVFPNDPYITTEWAVYNFGQSVNGTAGTPGADERAAAAWSVTTGTRSVVVALLDTGIEYTHPDLAGNVWKNPGGIGGCPAGTHGYNVLTGTCDPMDDDTAYGGHGSHVSGIIGAVGNNGIGIAGVNWTTSLMGVKWVDSSGNGFTSDLISAMDWVIAAKKAGVNVRVANDSPTWPGTAFSQALSDEIDLLGTNNILFVTAAGNTSQDNDIVPRYPCSYNRPTMICVAASDQNDALAGFSNYGVTTVKLAAPGVNIYSTVRQGYGFIDGSSMSAAQVSGAAALILSRGNRPVANLRETILSNVDADPALTGYVATGGRLNICKAIPGCH